MVTVNPQKSCQAETFSKCQDASLDVHPSIGSRVKRTIDILGAFVGLLITAVLFVPIAIAIRLDTSGPILYSQLRCGYRGKLFRLWKFRSMVRNAEQLKHQVRNQAKGLIFKNDRDPRVTRVGRLLRSTSLDELPQFWNVLAGQMSLVGTRPPTPEEVQHYSTYHWQRLNVKPGLTGVWQVSGRSSVLDFEKIVEFDLQYQAQWSVMYDLHLTWKTIQSVFSRHGAF